MNNKGKKPNKLLFREVACIVNAVNICLLGNARHPKSAMDVSGITLKNIFGFNPWDKTPVVQQFLDGLDVP